jgi:arylsulfatase A-like enzyme
MSAPPRVAPALRRVHDWWRRHLGLTLVLGLGLGIVGQLAVLALDATSDATVGPGAAAIAYTSAGWVVLGMLLAFLTQPLLRSVGGRIVALGLSATVLALLALTQVLGVVLRVLSGAYLTSGAVRFSLNSSEHFLHAASGNYWGIAAGIVALLVVLGAVIARALHPAAMHAERNWPHPKLMALGVVLAAMLVLVYEKRGDSSLLRRMFASGPLVALVGSLDASNDLALGSKLSTAPKAFSGPPRADGEGWEQTVRDTASGARPNVVLVVLESVGVDHLSHRGYTRPTTPHLDQLARDGLAMTRAWSTATHSNYSQMAILSSLFPRRGHTLDVYHRLDYPRVLFHDVFHLAGYDTATVSSQDENWQGMRRFQDTGTPTYYWFSRDYRGGKLDTGTERVVPDARTLDVALEWLGRNRSAPWALYLNLQATHFPYLLPPDAERRWQPDEPTWATFNYLRYPESERELAMNRYDNALAYVDAQLGRLYDYLESTGQLDDTLWIVTSDHGEAFFHKGLVTHGKTLYDFEARVPLILHWPARIDPEIRDEPVSTLDVMPTILDYVGLPPHPSYQGKSFREPTGNQSAIYMNIQGLRFADGIVCWPYKLVLDRTDRQQLFFDLSRDPHEEDDLSNREPQKARKLADTLEMQLIAQLEYHREDSTIRGERYQPRLLPCPDLD